MYNKAFEAFRRPRFMEVDHSLRQRNSRQLCSYTALSYGEIYYEVLLQQQQHLNACPILILIHTVAV
jgi:hypothetical protein